MHCMHVEKPVPEILLHSRKLLLCGSEGSHVCRSCCRHVHLDKIGDTDCARFSQVFTRDKPIPVRSNCRGGSHCLQE